jgi:hypothetical protein
VKYLEEISKVHLLIDIYLNILPSGLMCIVGEWTINSFPVLYVLLLPFRGIAFGGI